MARGLVDRWQGERDFRRILAAVWDQRDVETAAECMPALDVIETERGLEILVDVPGVPASAIDVHLSGDALVIAGTKQAAACQHDGAGFHLAERTFGRFGRAIAIEGAYDGARATASLRHGELRIVLPRLEERRGRGIRIPVRDAR
ncbi:MAG TPA: Hsp20/alpha crystallin family protein [Vicinamibacterales bacterium]|jgi:HSP20 family protein